MPADPTAIRAFADSITGVDVGLPTPTGVVKLAKADLIELLDMVDELAAMRADQQARDEQNAQLAADLGAYVADLQATDTEPTLAALTAILNGEDVAAQAQHDPRLVAVVSSFLATLGEDRAEHAVELLDVIEQFVTSAPDWDESSEPVVQQLLQGPPAPPAPAEPTRRPASVRAAVRPAPLTADGPRPGFGMPAIPADPPPFKEVTAEELFGLRRGPNGRYDAGEQLSTNGSL